MTARGFLRGFVLGLALYPWRARAAAAFEGWSRAQCGGYRAGLVCALLAAFALGQAVVMAMVA